MLLGMVLVILLVQTMHKAYRTVAYDFTSYLLSSEALFEGKNPYVTGTLFPYIYTLFLAFVLTPMTVLPYWLANLCWFTVSGTGLLLSFLVIAQEADGSINTRSGWGPARNRCCDRNKVAKDLFVFLPGEPGAGRHFFHDLGPQVSRES